MLFITHPPMNIFEIHVYILDCMHSFVFTYMKISKYDIFICLLSFGCQMFLWRA